MVVLLRPSRCLQALLDNFNISLLSSIKSSEMSNERMVSVQALEATFRIQHLIRKVSHQHIFRPFWNADDTVLPRNCEIFVCRLPRNVMEGELVPLFANFGQIFEMRLIVRMTDDTRGRYCYVTYMRKKMAMNAIRALHGYQLRQNAQPIACYPSLNNRRLFFDGLPLDEHPSIVEYAIRIQITSVVKVVLLNPNIDFPTTAVAFVEFQTHCQAATCLGKYFPDKLRVCGRRINMEFAVPSPPLKKNNILLLKDLPRYLTKMEMLIDLSRILPEPIRITRAFKSGRYAILRFRNDLDAQMARDTISEQGVRGPVITTLFNFDAFGEIEFLWKLQLMKMENIRIPYRLFIEDFY